MVVSAASWLIEQLAGDEGAGLTVVVVPGGRAGRLLRSALAVLGARGGGSGRLVAAPTIVTPGEVAETVLRLVAGEVSRPAGPMARQVAWRRAVAAVPGRVRSHLAGDSGPAMPGLPEGDRRALEAGRWRSVASMLASASDELAREGLRFIDVAERAGVPSPERYRAAGSVQHAYELELERTGRVDPALWAMDGVSAWEASAREMVPVGAIGGAGARAGRLWRVVLAGVAELGAVAKRALRLARAGGVGCVPLVMGTDADAARFDEFGCVRAGAWAERAVRLPGRDVVIVDGPAEQAEAAWGAVAEASVEAAARGEPLTAGGVVIGVPDEAVVMPLRRLAAVVDGRRVASDSEGPARITVREAAGDVASNTPAARALRALVAWVRGPTWHAMVGAVREPMVREAIERLAGGGLPGRWLALVDGHGARVSPRAGLAWALAWVDDDEEDGGGSGGDERRALQAVGRALATLVEPIASVVRAGAPARGWGATWASAFGKTLIELHGPGLLREAVPEESARAAALVGLRVGLDELAGLDELPGLDELADADVAAVDVADGGSGGLSEAAGLLFEALSRTPVRTDAGDVESIELLGWLELAWDPSSVAVVTGMNEGRVPGGVLSDALLPDGLRARLGLEHDASRLARDAWLLTVMVRSKRRVVVVAGRRDGSGEPLVLSRLLLRDESSVVAERLGAWAGVGGASDGARARRRVVSGLASGFVVRPMVPGRALKTMSVTSFRDYLRSPYVFYLKHVLGVREAEPTEREWSERSTGTLLHDVLARFGRSEVAGSSSAGAIERWLMEALRERAAGLRAGRERGVQGRGAWDVRELQVEVCAARLRAFAERQAAMRNEGWVIRATEWSRPEEAAGASAVVRLEEGRSMAITGSIDRLDQHEGTGAWRIVDIKTGDTGSKPAHTHGGPTERSPGRAWKDLQLPLYGRLAAMEGGVGLIEPGAEVELGYLVLPRRVEETGFVAAGWGAGALESAAEAARGVVRGVMAGAFGEIGEGPGAVGGALGRLCGTGVLLGDAAGETAGEVARELASELEEVS